MNNPKKSSRRIIIAFAAIFLTGLMILPVLSSAAPIEGISNIGSLSAARAFAAVSTGNDGKIYTIGGYDGGAVDTVLIYDPSTGTTDAGTNIPVGVYHPGVAKAANGTIYVFGGATLLANVQIYTPSTDTWTAGAAAPVGIQGASTVTVANGSIYLFGTSWSDGTLTMRYDPMADSWQTMASSPNNHFGGSAVQYNSTAIFVIGGGAGVSANTDVYNPVTNSWTSVANKNVGTIYGGAALGRNGYIYYVGGSQTYGYWGGPYLSTIERYSVTDDSWTIIDSTLNSARSSFGTTVDSFGRIFVVGGYNGGAMSSIEMIIPSDVSALKEIVIQTPMTGSTVTGTVSVMVGISPAGLFSSYMTIDFYVDGVWKETKDAGSTWTFDWDTSGLVDGSAHTLMVTAFDWDGKISTDSVSVTVSSMSLDEKIAELQQNISDLQAQLAALNESMNQTSNDLADQIDALQNQLDALQTTGENANTNAASANTMAMLAMILALIAVILIALNIVMTMRKKS